MIKCLLNFCMVILFNLAFHEHKNSRFIVFSLKFLPQASKWGQLSDKLAHIRLPTGTQSRSSFLGIRHSFSKIWYSQLPLLGCNTCNTNYTNDAMVCQLYSSKSSCCLQLFACLLVWTLLQLVLTSWLQWRFNFFCTSSSASPFLSLLNSWGRAYLQFDIFSCKAL